MANLHKYTVQESLNASQGSAGNWSVNSRQTVNASGGATIHLALSSNTHILLLQPTVETQISFTTEEADIVANDDISIPATNLTSIQVPRGLGHTIVLNILGVSSSGTMKVVEV